MSVRMRRTGNVVFECFFRRFRVASQCRIGCRSSVFLSSLAPNARKMSGRPKEQALLVFFTTNVRNPFQSFFPAFSLALSSLTTFPIATATPTIPTPHTP